MIQIYVQHEGGYTRFGDVIIISMSTVKRTPTTFRYSSFHESMRFRSVNMWRAKKSHEFMLIYNQLVSIKNMMVDKFWNCTQNIMVFLFCSVLIHVKNVVNQVQYKLISGKYFW